MTWVSVMSDGRGSVADMTTLTGGGPPDPGIGSRAAPRLVEGPLEPRQAPDHRLALHGERDADVPGHAEARAGDGEHALLGQQAHERHVVLDRRAREHVERALRLHALVADAREPFPHEVALLAIGRDVDD